MQENGVIHFLRGLNTMVCPGKKMIFLTCIMLFLYPTIIHRTLYFQPNSAKYLANVQLMNPQNNQERTTFGRKKNKLMLMGLWETNLKSEEMK